MAPAALARSRPITSALYSASLLVVGKSRRTMHSTVSPSGDSSTTPPPPPLRLAYWMIRLYVCSTEETPLPLVLVVGELCYELCNDLYFDGGSQVVLDVKFAQFYGL